MSTEMLAGLRPEGLARLREVFDQMIGRGRLPGAVMMIERNGTIGFLKALGQQDAQHGVPMREDSIFRIHSMTKPIVSVALMMLAEQGRVLLRDPVARYLPEFANARVGVEHGARLQLLTPRRPMSVHDLLRHTAGLTYEFLPPSAVRQLYIDSDLSSRARTNSQQLQLLAALPLMHEPGSIWEYSRATDVLGRLVEVLTDLPLGEHLRRAIFEPLCMPDTGFAVDSTQCKRLAEPHKLHPDTGAAVTAFDASNAPALQSGGGGLLSTALDYARFLRMLLGGGQSGDVRLLGRKTVEFMTADHLGPIPRSGDILPPGHGFGLGFAVKTELGCHTEPGSIGAYGWSGSAGTAFFVDPREAMFALIMVQAPDQLDEVRELFRQLVYAAVD